MLKEIVEKGHYCFVEKVDSWQDAFDKVMHLC